MKKIYLLTAALAGLVLAGCTSNDFVGDLGPSDAGVENETAEGAINFGSGFRAVTRDAKVGADAAKLLGNKFYVTGVKGDGTVANMTGVFKTYSVEWEANTAGKTESNTSDWEYVGKNHDWNTGATATGVTSQTIKYWDFNTDYYDFAAYSLGGPTGTATGTVITYTDANTGAYTLTGTADQLSKCYITDMTTVAKANYGNEVTLNFRSLVTKVRMAIYETVPGYSVKDVFFYENDDDALMESGSGTGELSNDKATLFGGTSSAGAFYTGGTYTVSFPNIGIAKAPGGANATSDYNKAHVKMTSGTTTATTKAFGELNYDSNGFLGKTSTEATFAGDADPWYQIVLPNESGAVLEMRVNYTLVADDGGAEEITIHGAKAFVPLQFTQWKPNYAYTYIFKISDNTNGWTSTNTDDPAGLFPITFDAIVLDPIDATTEQTTITTVATPSITTYQKGHLYTDGPEYSAAKGKVYVQVMVDGNLKADLDSKGKLYVVTGSTPISEATVMDALSITESTGVGRNGLTLTDATSTASVNATITAIPGEDGNSITVATKTAAEFTPTANTTYTYVYDTDTWSGTKVHLTVTPADFTTAYYTTEACTTQCTGTVPDGGGDYYQRVSYIYTAVTCATKPSDWDTAGIWYLDPDGKTLADTWEDGTHANKIFYKKYTVDGKIYGVKVIKVVS